MDWRMTWKGWAPTNVKMFLWLAKQDRCWTAERLAKRGLAHPPRCVLCDQDFEDIHHLLAACIFSREIWHRTLAWCKLTVSPPNGDLTLYDWWRDATGSIPVSLRKALASLVPLVTWDIWKHRNACIFDLQQPSARHLFASIQDDVRTWASAGAKGLQAVIDAM
ncbi:uncharacterized protein [Aegilops tauschii subsp. strangulata]|uniref:uncharacterized protein n=1 Tax=Aegilops tauschii subsp. strangulata TaxID=200361 RepID=UPI003CC87852